MRRSPYVNRELKLSSLKVKLERELARKNELENKKALEPDSYFNALISRAIGDCCQTITSLKEEINLYKF